MALRQLVKGLKWVKDKASKFNRGLSAVVKVSTMAGNAAFIANRFFAWALRVPQGWDTTPGLIGAVVLSSGVAVDTIVGRALNMYYPNPHSITNGPDDPRAIAKHATFLYPGMPSSRAGRAAYITLQMNCLLFMLNSGFGSFQNQFSIEMLFGKIPTLELDSTCEATQSSETKIIIAHLIALYAAYSAIKSYRSSNLLRLRQYYIRYILQGEWRQFGFRSYFEALMTTGLYTRSIAFNTKHTWELLEKNSLCHIPLDLIPVPSGVILGHTLESCAVNVTTNFGSALAAAHKRNTNRTVVELSALLENAPRWRFWDKFIRVCFYITALSTSTGTFTALVDGTYEYWVIALAVIAALFSGRNQLSTSYEAYIQQLEMRSANPDLLQAALLEEADVEAVQNDDVESPAENYLPPAINDRLSVAPSATLFGISNPANLAAQPLSPTTTIDVKADIIPADPISPPVPQ